jgi:hypothetical protein
MLGKWSAAHPTDLVYRRRLFNGFGLDWKTRLAPGLEASLQRDCVKTRISEHERRTGAGFFVESSAIRDDGDRPRQFVEAVGELFGRDANCARDRLMHERIDARGDYVQHDGLAGLDHRTAIFGCDS